MKKQISLITLAAIFLSTSTLACSIICGDCPERPSAPNTPLILFWVVVLTLLFFVFFSNMGPKHNRKYILALLVGLFMLVVIGIGRPWCDLFATCSPEAYNLAITSSNTILILSPLLGLCISAIIRKRQNNIFNKSKNPLIIGIVLILILVSLIFFLESKQNLVDLNVSSESYNPNLVNNLITPIERSQTGMITNTAMCMIAGETLPVDALTSRVANVDMVEFKCDDLCANSTLLEVTASSVLALSDAKFNGQIECTKNMSTNNYDCEILIKNITET